MQTYVCLWPCESWHLEPFCIHTYIHKYSYTCIVWCIVSYLNPCCVKSHMFAPLRAFTLRTPLYTSILFEVYIFSIIDRFLYERMLCKLTYVVALRVLTLRTFLYTCISSQVYMYHTIDTLVYEPKLCELTHVRALSNAHTLNLFVYMKKFANIHISYDRYFVYELKFCEFTYVSAVACPHFEALCIQAHTYKYTYVIA